MSRGLSRTFQLKNGHTVRVDCIGAGLFRIRMGAG